MDAQKRIVLGFVLLFCCIFILTGCETLQKKFTRKRKKAETEEEMVVVPRDYSTHPFPNDVLYKQYFVYWKSWNQELITSLNDQAPYKKIFDCTDQAILNLKKMATYLNDEKAKELGVYIQQTEQLKGEIVASKSMPPSQLTGLRYTAERILSNVNRQFDSRKMKDFLK